MFPMAFKLPYCFYRRLASHSYMLGDSDRPTREPLFMLAFLSRYFEHFLSGQKKNKKFNCTDHWVPRICGLVTVDSRLELL